jgi:8-oxo-dGTP pyrophosphatase MutT (NUDIX family)
VYSLASAVVTEVEARPSAVVILARDGEQGVEVFMVRRHARAEVIPNAYVFPGGTVRADDYDLAADGAALAAFLSARSDTPVDPRDAIGMYACAIRELFEEAGILLVTQACAFENARSLRDRLNRRELSLQRLLTEETLRPAFERLIPFAHWVTPFGIPARFDTRFFVAEMPEEQEALHCAVETSDGAWLTPRALLHDGYELVFATEQQVRRLAPFSSVAGLLAFARTKAIRRTQPSLEWDGPSWTPILTTTEW